MAVLLALIAGLVFGSGLILAGMTDPAKVLAFLDLAGTWDPSLALVMASAVAVASVAFAIARHRDTTWLGAPMALPARNDLDIPLLAGSLLFGVGWGLSGFCPGPGLVGLSTGYLPAVVFVIAMIFGMEGYEWLVEAQDRRRQPAPATTE